MLSWLRENVVTDRIHSLLTSGCFAVARVMAACVVLMIAAVVACGCTHKPEPQLQATRDEVRAAVYASEYGLHNLYKECERFAVATVNAGHLDAAQSLADVCDGAVEGAQPDVNSALKELAAWTPNSAAKVECNLSNVMSAYWTMGSALRALGYDSPEAQDGMARTQWLVQQAKTCGR